MLVVFRSNASADLLYFGDVARQLLTLIGKEASERGVITVDQLPAAIARLEAAIAADRPQHDAHLKADERLETDDAGHERPQVSLTRRALPLLAMLKEALAAEEPVTWGV